jgi:hypothetical protein
VVVAIDKDVLKGADSIILWALSLYLLVWKVDRLEVRLSLIRQLWRARQGFAGRRIS